MDHAASFWPTLVGDSLALRYKLIKNFSERIDRLHIHTLETPKPPSGRVDAVQWKDGFLITWVSRAKDRPSVDLAFVDSRGKATLASAMAEPELRGRATGFPRIAGDGGRALVVWPELEDGTPVIGIGLIH